MQIILVRGLPGSGKSTYARKHAEHPGFVHIESDMWFEKDGVYKFEPLELSNAHRWCVSSCEKLVRDGFNVIISNVFSSLAECAPYFVIGSKYGIYIEMVTCDANYGSIHGVPPEKIEMMKARFISMDFVRDIMPIGLHLFYNDPYNAYEHILNNPVS